MQITFAYTNDPTYKDNIGIAIAKNVATVFILEIAEQSLPSTSKPKELKWDMLDASQYEVKTRTRKKQTLETAPNLYLHSQKVGGVKHTDDYLLEQWFVAESRWVATERINDPGMTYALVKVLATASELQREKINGVPFLAKATIEIETVYAE